MNFSAWRKTGSRRHLCVADPQKNRNALARFDPRLRQVAYDRLAILREYHLRLSKPRRSKTKTKVMRTFLEEINSGILWPDETARHFRHTGRSTLYGWDRLHRAGGVVAIVPRYRTKLSTGKATFRPLAIPIEMKFPGHPKRRGEKEFSARLRRRWRNPPLECPIKLSIFYSMAIPKGTKMRRRMKMLKRQISHIGKPNLDSLNAFIVGCMTGIVFRDYSQIVHLTSEKKFDWWPQTRILLRPLKG